MFSICFIHLILNWRVKFGYELYSYFVKLEMYTKVIKEQLHVKKLYNNVTCW